MPSLDLTAKKISETYQKMVQIDNYKLYDGLGTEICDLRQLNKYTHLQSSSSLAWIIIHNLGFKPNIVIFDSAENVVIGDIVHNSLNQATITFSAPFVGEAYCS